MKKIAILAHILLPFVVSATEDTLTISDTAAIAIDSEELMAYFAFADSVNKALNWEHGSVVLGSGLADLEVPEGYKYLGAEQTEFLMSDVFGNPPEASLGMLAHEDYALGSDIASYFVEITYAEEGFIDDEDAEDIDYDELLEEMREDEDEINAQREAQGYPTVEMVGWASDPYYDQETKKLHWAKELKFGGEEENTLNYNIRILGRKGYLVMNAIGGMDMLPKVKEDIDDLLGSVHFQEGNRYSDFNPDIDKVAAYGIGGLVAGKLLAKAGFFAVILKFWKFIAIGAVALFAGVKKFFTGGE